MSIPRAALRWSLSKLRKVLGHKPGDTVKLKVERNGQQRTIEVQLGTRPDQVAQQG